MFGKTSIVGIFGLQGCGKTMLMTMFGWSAQQKGERIFSNYKLEYPFTPINTFDDITRLNNGLFLADELWLWAFARSSMSRLNQDLMKIVMLNRKRNVGIMYTAQTIGQADKLLRNVTNYWIKPAVIPIMQINEEKFIDIIETAKQGNTTEEQDEALEGTVQALYGMVTSPHNYRIIANVYDANFKFCCTIKTTTIATLGELYDTREEIGDLQIREVPFTIKQGIEMENYFVASSKQIPWIQETDHLPNSGRGSGKKFDVIFNTDYGGIAIDVKTTNQTRVSIHPEHIQKQIINAEANQLIPFIAFPKMEATGKTEQLQKPENWYLHPLENSYLLGLNQPPKYGKLIKNSILFPDLPIYLKNRLTVWEQGT